MKDHLTNYIDRAPLLLYSRQSWCIIGQPARDLLWQREGVLGWHFNHRQGWLLGSERTTTSLPYISNEFFTGDRANIS